LIPVSGLTALISGFNSTKIFSAYRGMKIGQVTLLELGSQVAGVLFTVACALVWPSIWALVLGGLFAALFKLLASHRFLPGVNNRPCLEPGAMQELVSFGRWIILSTFLSFTTNSAASLILGKFMTVADVGIFAIASTLANIVQQAYEQICSRVLLPLYSRIKDLPQDQLRSRVRRVRIAVMLTFAPPLCAMVLYGQALIEFLLDPRYHSGGWILQLFAASALPLVISGTSPYYLSTGNSLLMMKLSAARLGFYLTGCVVGWYLGGAHGIIWGIGLHTFASYVVDLAVQHRYRIWVPQLDLVAISVISAVLALGLGLGAFR
jgi:O-antigen/teichoic acid export membrane protein